MNRFFFRCPRCLFKFTADVEGFKAPSVGSCPVCSAAWVKCLGATKGVLRYDVPCNDKCVFAEGPDCSCACGGRNHGSRLLVPVVGNVVDFKGKLPTLERAAREWSAFSQREREARAMVAGDALKLRQFVGTMSAIYKSASWEHRKTALIGLCVKLGLAVASFGSLAPAVLPAVAPVESSGELFAWGEKWAHVSPQFRGHQFVVPTFGLGEPGVESVSFSPA